MPNVYAASAKIYVDTESLMDPVFKDIALPDDLDAQVGAVSRAILTRPNLEKVAVATDLHLSVESDEEMENLITILQEKIRVRGNSRSNVFDIDVTYKDKQKAKAVVAALVEGFVEGSLRQQGDDAQITLQAVESEIEQHNERLIDAEDQLAEFKKANVGYMPNDSGDYYSRLQKGLASLDELDSNIRSLAQRRTELARQLDSENAALGEMAAAGTLATGCSQQGQIAELQTQLAALQVDFTDKHPRILSLRENIDTLRDRCAAEANAARNAGVRPAAPTESSSEPNTLYENLRMMLADTDVELATLRAERIEKQLEIDELRGNVDKIADVEKNLKQLNRDYTVIQGRYQLLIDRRENLRSKLRLDPVKDISFRILEPPFAATDPVGPPRPLFLIFITVAAIGVGGIIAFGLNELNPVFYSRQQLAHMVGLPVLGAVSMLMSRSEIRSRQRSNAILASGYVVLIICTVFLVTFHTDGARLVQDLVRDVR